MLLLALWVVATCSNGLDRLKARRRLKAKALALLLVVGCGPVNAAPDPCGPDALEELQGRYTADLVETCRDVRPDEPCDVTKVRAKYQVLRDEWAVRCR